MPINNFTDNYFHRRILQVGELAVRNSAAITAGAAVGSILKEGLGDNFFAAVSKYPIVLTSVGAGAMAASILAEATTPFCERGERPYELRNTILPILGASIAALGASPWMGLSKASLVGAQVIASIPLAAFALLTTTDLGISIEPTYRRGAGYVPQPIRDEDLVTI